VLKKELEVCNGVKCDFSTIEELQPSAFKKDFFTISSELFKAITSQLCRVSSKKVTPAIKHYNKPTIQKIYYGCPGTGKSREVKRLTEGLKGEQTIVFDDGTTNIFRTTCHPDYDYTTFVGCYKPVKNAGTLDYKFVPQVFTNAYVAAKKHPETPIYLIIEEINRGNCAQIFGDLFQLLDRKNGVSEFPIDTEEELMKYLHDEAGIEDCKKLCLPANFNIYATMNTSDQSLFPMDSAFKRRWEMKYVKINYDIPDADFTFSVNGIDYHWLYYLPFFNDKITEASDSEDKQMGEFFVRKNMTSEEFKNKVMFYLWNDVCKDLYAGNNSPQSFFFRDLYGKPFKFTQLFNEPKADASEEDKKDPSKNGDVLLADFLHYIEFGKKKSPKAVAATPASTEGEENTDTE
jgi:MoxR-like ATPase